MRRRIVLLFFASVAAIAAAGMLLAGCGPAPAADSPAAQAGPSIGPETAPPDAEELPAPPSPHAEPSSEESGTPEETLPPTAVPSAPQPSEGTGQASGANPLAGGGTGKPQESARPPRPEQNTDPPVSAPPIAVTGDSGIVTGSSGAFTPGAMVSASWFDDALFIGDSRTDGLRLYARTGQADYFVSTGLTVYTALTKTSSDKNFPSQTLRSLLGGKTYGKVLICLGLNECGTNIQRIINAYQNLVYTVRQKQPGAVIILQGVMACGRAKARSSACFGPENINRLNANIKKMAAGAGAYYIDPNTVFADSEGYLPDYLSGDGCHFRAKYYPVWMNWIRSQVYRIPVGPGVSPVPEPTAAPTPEVTAAPASEPVPSPTPEADASPVPTAAPAPTPEAVPSPSPAVTAAPAPEPTAAPSPEAADPPAIPTEPQPSEAAVPAETQAGF